MSGKQRGPPKSKKAKRVANSGEVCPMSRGKESASDSVGWLTLKESEPFKEKEKRAPLGNWDLDINLTLYRKYLRHFCPIGFPCRQRMEKVWLKPARLCRKYPMVSALPIGGVEPNRWFGGGASPSIYERTRKWPSPNHESKPRIKGSNLMVGFLCCR